MKRALLAALGVFLVAVVCGMVYGAVQLAYRNGWWLLLFFLLGWLVYGAARESHRRP